jgi:hypothetical protein
MRKLLAGVSAAALSLLVAVVPLIAAENIIKEELLIPKKDQCLLFAKNCDDNAYVIQQRIDRLRNEIQKGPAVYSDDELNILKKRLNDSEKAMEFIFNEGA